MSHISNRIRYFYFEGLLIIKVVDKYRSISFSYCKQKASKNINFGCIEAIISFTVACITVEKDIKRTLS